MYIRKLFIILFTLLTLCGCQKNEIKKEDYLELDVLEIDSHGNIDLDISGEELLKNYEYGDLIKVQVLDKELIVPLVSNYSDVDSGKEAILLKKKDATKISLSCNYDSFINHTGYSADEIMGNQIKFSLYEKGAYLEEYQSRSISYTDLREDYPNLSDEEFANFRPMNYGMIKENYLYRSTSPIGNRHNRDPYSLKAMIDANIKTVINVTDSQEDVQEKCDVKEYKELNVFARNFSIKFGDPEYKEIIKDSLLFMIDHEGPYLIHCQEGKDRTGLYGILLESFMGATLEEIEEDYMITFYNYYGIKKGDDLYDKIVKINLVPFLKEIYQGDNYSNDNIKELTDKYLLSLGLSESDLDKLYSTLSK